MYIMGSEYKEVRRRETSKQPKKDWASTQATWKKGE